MPAQYYSNSVFKFVVLHVIRDENILEVILNKNEQSLLTYTRFWSYL